jgi:hypothetical protein
MARGRPGKRTLGWATRGGAAGYTAPAGPGGVWAVLGEEKEERAGLVLGLGWTEVMGFYFYYFFYFFSYSN